MSDEKKYEQVDSTFAQNVYKIVKAIPQGKVMTYGQIALLLGTPRASQQVGWALHWVVDSDDVPCQRVLNRFGGLAEGYGWGGQISHRADLEADGVEVKEDFTVDMTHYQWHPTPEEVAALNLPLEALDRLNSKLEFSKSTPPKKKVQQAIFDF